MKDHKKGTKKEKQFFHIAYQSTVFLKTVKETPEATHWTPSGNPQTTSAYTSAKFSSLQNSFNLKQLFSWNVQTSDLLQHTTPKNQLLHSLWQTLE